METSRKKLNQPCVVQFGDVMFSANISFRKIWGNFQYFMHSGNYGSAPQLLSRDDRMYVTIQVVNTPYI
jgi:hypothetical protein